MTPGPIELTRDAARRLRLRTQGLVLPDGAGPGPSPVDVVRAMVALQGQDLPAVLRAIAVRCRPCTTLDDVRAAFDTGDLVRGWTQRGTLFATTPGDLAALVSLTGERMLRSGRRNRETEGLDDAVVNRAEAVAREALGTAGPGGGVSRAAMLDLWQESGVPVEGQRGYHLIVTLALRGVLHWGPFAGAQQLMVTTPAAAVPAEEPDAVLRRVALSYFTSRGPATAEDLAWWLGLPKVPVRAAVSALREEHPDALVEVVADERVMLVGTGTRGPGRAAPWSGSDLESPAGVTLVPGFDEMVLGYQDRELIADAEAMRTAVPFVNGTFRPAVLLDGRLVGTWRRAPRSGEAPFELVPGITPDAHAEVAAAVGAWPLG